MNLFTVSNGTPSFTPKHTRRSLSEKVFASYLFTLFLLLLMFGLVVASAKAASHEYAKDGAGTVRSSARSSATIEDPTSPAHRSPVRSESSPEEEAAYQKAVDYERAGKMAKALKYYETAAGLGYPRAQYNLANHYYKGEIVPQDMDRAMALFTSAAKGGHTRAQFNLASILEKGRGVPKDEVQARHWYGAAAASGFARAASQLGVMWEEGRGGDADEDQAVRYYQQAADGDEPEPSALHNLGRLMLMGKGGLPRREDTVIAYFTKAAELGFAPAQVSLGHIYEDQGNHRAAERWYLEAVKRKHDKAYYFLGVLYEDGLGTGKDPKRAQDLYRLAAQVKPDGVNYTALQLAAKDGRLDAIKVMLEAGAEVEAGNRDGMTALKLALKYNHQGIIGYLQAIYDAHNIMGKKLEQRFNEQADAIAALQTMLHRASDGHDAEMAALYSKMYSTGADNADAIGVLRKEFARSSITHGTAIAALQEKTDRRGAATDDAIAGLRGEISKGGTTGEMRVQLSILMAKHEREQAEEMERTYIRSRESLGAFYRQFQMKLEGMFLAYKVLNTGLITREKDTTDKVAEAIGSIGTGATMVGHVLELAGDLVPLPFINTAIKVAGFLAKDAVATGLEIAGKALGMYHEEKVKDQTSLIAGLVENVAILDQQVEQAARTLTRIYEPQLSQLTVEGSKMLAECGVRRFLEYVRKEKASDKFPLSAQIIEAIATFESNLGMPPWTNKHIKTIDAVKSTWTDSGIYQETGIKTKEGRQYTNAKTKADKYGYRIADDALALKLGFR
jgi:TPR repeat protein